VPMCVVARNPADNKFSDCAQVSFITIALGSFSRPSSFVLNFTTTSTSATTKSHPSAGSTAKR
jgi:hypothetical protein